MCFFYSLLPLPLSAPPSLPPQGVKAQRKELEVRSLESRLEASEQSAELIKSFTSPQIVPQSMVVRTHTVTKQRRVSQSVASRVEMGLGCGQGQMNVFCTCARIYTYSFIINGSHSV